MKTNKIISIDSSTSKTGWAYWEDGQLKRYGLIDRHIVDIPELRIRQMINGLQQVLDKYVPQTVVVELTAVVRNEQTQRMLTMILGAILGWCVMYNAEFVALRPTEWRSYVQKGLSKMKRQELKQWAINKVKEEYKIDNINDDVAEGILIGRGYIIHKEEMENDIQ